jgi:hypothetical protein
LQQQDPANIEQLSNSKKMTENNYIYLDKELETIYASLIEKIKIFDYKNIGVTFDNGWKPHTASFGLPVADRRMNIDGLIDKFRKYKIVGFNFGKFGNVTGSYESSSMAMPGNATMCGSQRDAYSWNYVYAIYVDIGGNCYCHVQVTRLSPCYNADNNYISWQKELFVKPFCDGVERRSLGLDSRYIAWDSWYNYKIAENKNIQQIIDIKIIENIAANNKLLQYSCPESYQMVHPGPCMPEQKKFKNIADNYNIVQALRNERRLEQALINERLKKMKEKNGHTVACEGFWIGDCFTCCVHNERIENERRENERHENERRENERRENERRENEKRENEKRENKIDLFNAVMCGDLYNAVMCGDCAKIKLLIENKVDLNIQYNDGWSSLMIAVQNSNTCGNIETVKLLIDSGVDLNLQNKNGHTALMLAALNYDTDGDIENVRETVRLLTNSGADIYLQCKNGWTAITIKQLVESCADIQNKNNRTTVILESIKRKYEREYERRERERRGDERMENYIRENERCGRIRREYERIENERCGRIRREYERIENERCGRIRIENERIENERIENERIENERIENERIENERIENERIENERNNTIHIAIVPSDNKTRESSHNCCVCLEPINGIFALIPCGHTNVCPTCFENLKKNEQNIIECPICRQNVNNHIRIYYGS